MDVSPCPLFAVNTKLFGPKMEDDGQAKFKTLENSAGNSMELPYVATHGVMSGSIKDISFFCSSFIRNRTNLAELPHNATDSGRLLLFARSIYHLLFWPPALCVRLS